MSTDSLIGKLEALRCTKEGCRPIAHDVCNETVDKAIEIVRQHHAAQAYDPHHPDVTFAKEAADYSYMDLVSPPAAPPHTVPKCLLCDDPAAALCYFPQGCTCSPIKYQWRCLHHIERADGTKEAFTIVESLSPEIAAEQQPAIQGEMLVVDEKAWILPDDLLRFLCGEDAINGGWFGDKLNGKSYWWRSLLRNLRPYSQAPKPVLVSLEKCWRAYNAATGFGMPSSAQEEGEKQGIKAVLNEAKKQGAQFDVQD